MAAYSVRLYTEADHRSVQEIFTSGCYEHVSAAFYCTMRQPHSWLLLSLVLLLSFLPSGSMVLSIVGGIVALLLLWLPGFGFFHLHIRQGLAEDLKDIRKYYLQREGHCFWVVELDGDVVGMVSASPYVTPYETNVLELRRMYISHHHRGRGLAKLLCRTVIDFARKNGYHAVFLSTTSIMVSAIQLYQKMGFKRSEVEQHKKLLIWLIGMTWVGFRYGISSRR
ncbi:putative N-acetyltransferase family 8 member 5 [Leptodactylus fuscus]|uniref:putative N-acetyltransferase family 8 member 5 n=1 Tax=Leptodactylus fuscus TaxID=238119 RepID=UPI003F4EFEA1